MEAWKIVLFILSTGAGILVYALSRSDRKRWGDKGEKEGEGRDE